MASQAPTGTGQLSEATQSFFVFVRDNNTGQITAVAVPGNVQVGLNGTPADLTLLGRFSVNAVNYNVDLTNKGILQTSPDDTIIGVSLVATPLNGRIALYLSQSPREGELHFIKDLTGTSDTVPIDVYPTTGYTIDGLEKVTLSDPSASLALVFLDGNWYRLTAGIGASGGSGAPSNAPYILESPDASLPDSYTLAVSTNLTSSNTGPGGVLTLDLSQILGSTHAGTFTYATVTADAFGRITSISNGTTPIGPSGSKGILVNTSGNPYLFSVDPTFFIGTGGINITQASDGNLVVGINNNVIATISGSTFTGAIKAPSITASLGFLAQGTGTGGGFSGSLQLLADGHTPYLVGEGSVTIFTQSNGQVIISGSGGGGTVTSITGSGGTAISNVGGAYTVSSSIYANDFASYMLVSASSGQPPEARVLVPGTGVSLVDSGPGGTLTINVSSSIATSSSVGANLYASYLLVKPDAEDVNARTLTAGSGVSFSDSGPGGTFTISATGGGGGVISSALSASAYYGYCTGSIEWPANTSWTQFLAPSSGFGPQNFSDVIQAGITRSGSTFTVSTTGLYKFSANFNNYGSAYIALRVSSSNGTLLERTNYTQTPMNTEGVFQLNSGSTFVVEFATKGYSPVIWATNDPIGNSPDTENMRTGEIAVFLIANPITIAFTGSVTSNITGTFVPTDVHDVLWWPLHETQGPYAFNYGTSAPQANGTLTASANTVRWSQPGAIETSVGSNVSNGAGTLLTTNNFLVTANGIAPPAINTSSITLSCWFNPSLFPASTNNKIFHKSYYASQSTWNSPFETIGFCLVSATPAEGQLNYFLNTSSAGGYSYQTALSGSAAVNMWQHIGIVFDPLISGQIQYYLNGQMIWAQAVKSTDVVDVSQNGWWAIGNPSIPTQEYWPGYTEDVRVANVARSATWFQQVWNSGRPGFPNLTLLLTGAIIGGSSSGGGGSSFVASGAYSGPNAWVEEGISPISPIPGGTQIRTTSSVSVDSLGRIAGDIGTDVFFYVSGTTGLPIGTSGRQVAVFGGNLVASGSIHALGGESIDGTGASLSSKGTDVFVWVSGTVGVPTTAVNRKVAVFGGDVILSGNVIASSPGTGFTGSLTQTANPGNPLIVGLGSVFVSTNSVGQIIVSGSGGGGGGGSSGISLDNQGVPLSHNPYTLINFVGNSVIATDGGGGGVAVVTISSSIGADPGAEYVLLAADAGLANSRRLVAGTNITITDGGAGSTLTVAATGGGSTVSRGLFSARPSPGNAGNTYKCSDLPFEYYDDGTHWQQSYMGFPCASPVANGWNSPGWIPINITATESSGTVGDSMKWTTNSSDSECHGWIAGSIVTGSGGIFTVECGITSLQWTSTYSQAGLMVSDGTKFITWVVYWSTSTSQTIDFGMGTHIFSNSTTRVAGTGGSDSSWSRPRPIIFWVRLRYDGTNYNFEYSYDKLYWYTSYSGTIGGQVGEGAYLTPTQWGFEMENDGGVASNTNTGILISLKQTPTNGS